MTINSTFLAELIAGLVFAARVITLMIAFMVAFVTVTGYGGHVTPGWFGVVVSVALTLSAVSKITFVRGAPGHLLEPEARSGPGAQDE